MARPSTKTLIVVRHAHRDKKLGREVDNGLSKKGWKQAREFTRYFERWYGGIPAKILSSPKLRCVETVRAIADLQAKKIKIVKALDEQGPRESEKAYRARVRKFFKEWEKGREPLLVLCSHGDWIPTFFDEGFGIEISLKKGDFLEVEWE